jgi:hypothetical protein
MGKYDFMDIGQRISPAMFERVKLCQREHVKSAARRLVLTVPFHTVSQKSDWAVAQWA